MAYDKVVDSAALDSIFTDIAGAVREKNNSTNSIAHTALAAAIRAIQGGEGDYVWKKYPIIEFVQQNKNDAKGDINIIVNSNVVDLTKVDSSFFIGAVFKRTDLATSKAQFHFTTSDKCEFTLSDGVSVSEHDWTYNPTTKTITVVMKLTALGTWEQSAPCYASVDYVVNDDETAYPNGAIHTDGYYYEKGESGQYVWEKLTAQGGDFIDYVVSDNPSAYPDGGEQDGYWYERVEGTKYGMFFNSFDTDGYPLDIDITNDVIPSNLYNGISNIFEKVQNVRITANNADASAFMNAFDDNDNAKIKVFIKNLGTRVFGMCGGSDADNKQKYFLSNDIESIANYSAGLFYNTSTAHCEVYCEPASRPDGWAETFNRYSSSKTLTTIWGVTEEQFDAL